MEKSFDYVGIRQHTELPLPQAEMLAGLQHAIPIIRSEIVSMSRQDKWKTSPPTRWQSQTDGLSFVLGHLGAILLAEDALPVCAWGSKTSMIVEKKRTDRRHGETLMTLWYHLAMPLHEKIREGEIEERDRAGNFWQEPCLLWAHLGMYQHWKFFYWLICVHASLPTAIELLSPHCCSSRYCIHITMSSMSRKIEGTHPALCNHGTNQQSMYYFCNVPHKIHKAM